MSRAFHRAVCLFNIIRNERNVSMQGEVDRVVNLCRKSRVPVDRMEITGEVTAVFLTVIVWCSSRITEMKNLTRWQICNF